MAVACVTWQIPKRLCSETAAFVLLVVPEGHAQEHRLNAAARELQGHVTDLQGLLQVREGAAVQPNDLKTDFISAV